MAQIGRKEHQDANKEFIREQKAFEVIKGEKPLNKVDVQYQLERKIIEILLLYGNKEEDFEDLILKENEVGELILEPIVNQAKVFEKIYLDLQEDEMEFSNPKFKDLYYTIVDTLNQDPDLGLKNFVNSVEPEIANEITTILMEDERHNLHNWESKNIFPKGKENKIAQLVNETILNLRCFLISKKIDELSLQTQKDLKEQHKDILDEVISYKKLDNLLSRKLQKPL